jgi:hypothetical protein
MNRREPSSGDHFVTHVLIASNILLTGAVLVLSIIAELRVQRVERDLENALKKVQQTIQQPDTLRWK